MTSPIRQTVQPPKKQTSLRRPATSPSQTANTPTSSAEHINQLQRSLGNRAVQRLLQRAQSGSPMGMAGGPVAEGVQRQIESSRGGGKALDKGVSAKMGSSLGADFSGVRVHTDSKSNDLNRSLSASAFTTGSDIFFSQGAYNPGTGSGQQLLAHELTHVVQQGGTKPNKVQTKLTVGAANDVYEREADQVAANIGKTDNKSFMTQAGALQRSTTNSLQRKPERIANPQHDPNSLTRLLRPLAEKGLNRKGYKNRLYDLIEVFKSQQPNLSEEVKDAVVLYLTAQTSMFESVRIGDALTAKNSKTHKETDEEGNEKDVTETGFGPLANTAIRGMKRSAKRYGRNRNWREKKGFFKKTGSMFGKGVGFLGTVISTKLVGALTSSKATSALKSSPMYLNLVDAYDELTHIYRSQLDKAFRPEAVLAVASLQLAGEVAGAMDKKTVFGRWWGKRKARKLKEDMNDQGSGIDQNHAVQEEPHLQNNENDEDSSIDEEI